jgi:uncharacterized protein YggE
MKRLFALLTTALCLLISAGLFAQAAGSYLYNNPQSFNTEKAFVNTNSTNGNVVTLKAEVMMNVKATSYTAIFAAVQSGKNAWQVDSLMNIRIDQVKYALGQLGIKEDNIHVDAVSMVPTYAHKLEEKKFSKKSIEIPVGFEMKKNVHVLFRDHKILDQIISEMAFAEIYDMVKVEYNIDGMNTYYELLRQEAMAVIASKEKTYSGMKMHLDISSMSDGFNCTYPMERYKSYTAYNSGATYEAVVDANNYINNTILVKAGRDASVTIDTEKKKYEQQFIVQTAEKNKTIFYDRIPYNQFDKVINADEEEPSIQLFYTLVTTYTMMTQENWDKIKKQEADYQKQLELSKLTRKQKRHAKRNRS